MKKLKLLFVVFMAMAGLSVHADEYLVGQRFTSIAELDGKIFAVVDEASGKAMSIGVSGHGNGWDMYFGTYAEASTSNACFYKIEPARGDGVDGCYYLRALKFNGSLYTAWEDANTFGYFNSQIGTGGYFALGLKGQNGQDGSNLAVWKIEVSEGKFAIKNKATDKYLHADQLSNTYDDPFYFTFCTLETLAALKAKFDERKSNILALNSSIDVSAAVTLKEAATTIDEIYNAFSSLTTALGDYLATTTNTDVTSIFIDNPSFESNHTGWANIGMAIQDNTAFEKDGNNYCEAWQPNGTRSVSQISMNVPTGKYKLSAKSRARGVTSAKIFAGDKETKITISDNTDTYEVKFFGDGGNVAIGFEGLGTGAGASWMCVDNFQLIYEGPMGAPVYVEEYNNAISNAQAIEGTIPEAAYDALSQVVSDNTLVSGTESEYNAATTNINQAIADATALVEPYSTWNSLKTSVQTYAQDGNYTKISDAIGVLPSYVETLTTEQDLNDVNDLATKMMSNNDTWNEVKAYANALTQVSNNNATANETLQNAISAQITVVNNASVADKDAVAIFIKTTLPNAVTALRTAMNTYVNAAQPINEECFDLTGLIVNPHFKEGGNASATGWTLESGSVGERRATTHNFEAWHRTFNLSQTIPDLPMGTYRVTLQGFARHDSDDKDKTNLYCGIVNQRIKDITDEYSTVSLISGKPNMGDGNGETNYKLNEQTVYQPNGMSASYYFFQETNPQTGKPFYTNEVQTLITEAGDLKIGFKCDTNSDWVIWDNFHLYYYGSAISVTIDESVGASFAEDIDEANVTLNRTFSDTNWNTFVVPFDIDNATLTEKFGTVEVAEYSESSADANNATVYFTKMATPAITANEPVLLKTSTAPTSVVFNGVALKAGDPIKEGTNFNFMGSYAASTYVTTGNYYLSANKLYKSAKDNGTFIKGTRAYFKAKTDDARIVNFFIGEETTGIKVIEDNNANNNALYNLNGQKVSNAKKGVFIQNGKKVIVK